MQTAAKRLVLVACLLVGVLSLGAGLASAAGKPTSVALSDTHEVNGYSVIELTAKVNPNGANTSTTIEYREDGAAEKVAWTKGTVHNLSGTTVRSFAEEFHIDPVKNYEVRINATNLFGTTLSATAHGVSTHIRTTGESELTNIPFASQGIATFVFTYVGAPVVVTCNESGFGHLGNSDGKADSYHDWMFDCITYVNGKESLTCRVKDFDFILSGPTLAVQNPFFIPLRPETEGCAAETYWPIYPKPFRVVDNGSYGEYGKKRSVTVTATATLFATTPAEVTIESEWALAAEYTNTPFKFVTAGL